ncbi:AAA family ATPase [Sediminitomix flava]|uniref:Dynein-related subfamily AAA family protein n=1 Tax=Sediminitomix flava TaxID=379075 RepID=A0A315ZBI6_SEDFL|nr:AAA family ATPase [Sediminitomix flava]PWJ42662.1 dynein-related subfamily AAA family protein [Sediminitomix flava]
MLDLGERLEFWKNKLQNYYENDYKEFSFSDTTKTEIKKIYPSISFGYTTFKYQNDNQQFIIAPNQWFLIASFCQEYINELNQCKKELETYFQGNLKKYFTQDELGKMRDEKIIPNEVDNLLPKDNNGNLLRKFLTEYEWWTGKKTGGRVISRTEFYDAPILSVCNLIAASSDLVTRITKNLIGKEDLIEAIKKDAEENTINPPQNKKYENLIQSDNINEFALKVFKYFYDGEWDKLLDKTCKKVNKGYIKHSNRILNDFIRERDPNDSALPNFVRIEGTNIFFNQTWEQENPEKTLVSDNLKKYFKEEFPLYKLTDKNGEYLLLKNNIDFKHNRLVYGAPGTGKSYDLNKDSKQFGTNLTRITFYPDYTYGKFVGSYKPVSKGEDGIGYEFVPGPFLLALEKAKDQPYLLIIEEINRANAAAVFGEAFQLLDRKNGASEYGVELDPMAQTWCQKKELLDENGLLKLPSNFYIWATMNSADQGVFPLDAAFKRRWSSQFVSIDDGVNAIEAWQIEYQGTKVNWNKLRTAINEQIQASNVAEDKLIGPFFLKEEELSDEKAIKYKLLLYLKDDVARHRPSMVFNTNVCGTTFSSIQKAYDANQAIFVDPIQKIINDAKVDTDTPQANSEGEDNDQE